MKKIIKSSLVWLSQEYQEKHLATFGQFTNPDNKENLQNNSHIYIIKKKKKKIFGHNLSKKQIYNKSIINHSKTNHKNPIIFIQFLPLI